MNKNDNKACCIEEITSMPNPFILWFGLLTVPIVGVLAWLRKNKAYALIVITYLLQWLPWMKSPRITFAYHFYVDIPLICLCNAIVLQQIWLYARHRDPASRRWAIAGIGAVVALIAGAFIFLSCSCRGTHHVGSVASADVVPVLDRWAVWIIR